MTRSAIVLNRTEAAPRILSLDETTRRVKHVISTGALDRGNRIVDVAGWRLSKFQRNPVVLADHDYSIERVIGRATDTRVERNALVSTTEFAEEGLGNVAFRLVQAGLVNAWSVGWTGIKSHELGSVKDCEPCQSAEVQRLVKGKKFFFGTHFTQQELLEYSLVAVPANPEAVMGLQAAGLVAGDEASEWIQLARRRPVYAASRVADPPDVMNPFEGVDRERFALEVALNRVRFALEARGGPHRARDDFSDALFTSRIARACESVGYRIRLSSRR